MVIHFHWWYIPLLLWAYCFIGVKLDKGYLAEHSGMWTRHERAAAVFRMLIWPIIDFVLLLVED